jgi:hypothetical protein
MYIILTQHPTPSPDTITAYIYTNTTLATYPLIPTLNTTECSSNTNPLALPNKLLYNTNFENGALPPWTHTTSGSTHPESNIPSTRAPHSGNWAYHGHGVTADAAWGVALSQHVTVTPRRSYSVVLWSRQDKPGNCVGSVMWRANTIRVFTPGTEYERVSVMFPVWDARDGDVAIGFECVSGGEGAGVYLDDVDMKIGWAG